MKSLRTYHGVSHVTVGEIPLRSDDLVFRKGEGKKFGSDCTVMCNLTVIYQLL
jgi:hypothetical protein